MEGNSVKAVRRIRETALRIATVLDEFMPRFAKLETCIKRHINEERKR